MPGSYTYVGVRDIMWTLSQIFMDTILSMRVAHN